MFLRRLEAPEVDVGGVRHCAIPECASAPPRVLRGHAGAVRALAVEALRDAGLADAQILRGARRGAAEVDSALAELAHEPRRALAVEATAPPPRVLVRPLPTLPAVRAWVRRAGGDGAAIVPLCVLALCRFLARF